MMFSFILRHLFWHVCSLEITEIAVEALIPGNNALAFGFLGVMVWHLPLGFDLLLTVYIPMLQVL